MKYNYKKKLIVIRVIFGILLISNELLAGETHLTGCIKKVFNDGIKQPFSNQKIKIKDAFKNTTTYSEGCFDFNLTSSKNLMGKEITLEVPDSDWYMYEPSHGFIFSPKENETKDINIFMIRKDSSAYLTLFSIISHYSIQVAHLTNESSAINMVKRLRKNCTQKTHRELPNWLKKPCWKESKQKECIYKKQKQYCMDSIYHQSLWKNNTPNNGYMYNVQYGHYYNRVNAKKDLNNIKALRGGWIKPYPKVEE